MTDITVTAPMGPQFKGTKKELEIICSEIVAYALHSPGRPVLPSDVRVRAFTAQPGDLRPDVIVWVSDPEGGEAERPQQTKRLLDGLRSAFEDAFADRSVATRFHASISDEPYMHAPRPLFDHQGPDVHMSVNAAIGRARQRIMQGEPTDRPTNSSTREMGHVGANAAALAHAVRHDDHDAADALTHS